MHDVLLSSLLDYLRELIGESHQGLSLTIISFELFDIINFFCGEKFDKNKFSFFFGVKAKKVL